MTRAPEQHHLGTARRGDRRRRRTVLAVTVAFGLLTAGCGSGDSPDAAATATSSPQATSGVMTTSTTATDLGSEQASAGSCDMLSDDIAGEVLGVSIVRREPHGEPGAQTFSCIKGSGRADEPEDYFFVGVSVITDGASLVDQAGSEPGSDAVTGLGDRAVYLADAGTLFVASGADLVQVQVNKGPETGSQRDCVTVATDVLARLA